MAMVDKEIETYLHDPRELSYVREHASAILREGVEAQSAEDQEIATSCRYSTHISPEGGVSVLNRTDGSTQKELAFDSQFYDLVEEVEKFKKFEYQPENDATIKTPSDRLAEFMQEKCSPLIG